MPLAIPSPVAAFRADCQAYPAPYNPHFEGHPVRFAAAHCAAGRASDRIKERLMAEEKVEPRETNWRHLLPWTELFRGFQVALDLNKLVLAAAGILVMAFGWWLLALLFRAGETGRRRTWPGNLRAPTTTAISKAWDQFRQDRDHWNLMHETAGLGDPDDRVGPIDLIDSLRRIQRQYRRKVQGDSLPSGRSQCIGADKARGRGRTRS